MHLCTGGEIASTFDAPDCVRLGKCKVIEEVMIGEDKLIKFSGKSSSRTRKTKEMKKKAFLFGSCKNVNVRVVIIKYASEILPHTILYKNVIKKIYALP